MRLHPRLISIALLAGTAAVAAAEGPIHHDLEVRLDPTGHRIDVVDQLRPADLPADPEGAGYRFVLHAGLDPEVTSPGWRLERLEEESAAGFLGINATSENAGGVLPLEVWRLVPGESPADFVGVRYGGVIHHELATSGEEYQRSFSETPGLIDERFAPPFLTRVTSFKCHLVRHVRLDPLKGDPLLHQFPEVSIRPFRDGENKCDTLVHRAFSRSSASRSIMEAPSWPTLFASGVRTRGPQREHWV